MSEPITQYYEYKDEIESKFLEITLDGINMHRRYGPIKEGFVNEILPEDDILQKAQCYCTSGLGITASIGYHRFHTRH